MPLRGEDWFNCFGCAAGNARGLQLEPRRTGRGHAECDVTFAADLCSYPGIVHGGLITTACDDLMANLILIEYAVLTLSVSLRTRFLEPVRTGVPHVVMAEITGNGPESFSAAAELTTTDGRSCAVTQGTFAPVRAEHADTLFAPGTAEHERWSAHLAGRGTRRANH